MVTFLPHAEDMGKEDSESIGFDSVSVVLCGQRAAIVKMWKQNPGCRRLGGEWVAR